MLVVPQRAAPITKKSILGFAATFLSPSEARGRAAVMLLCMIGPGEGV